MSSCNFPTNTNLIRNDDYIILNLDSLSLQLFTNPNMGVKCLSTKEAKIRGHKCGASSKTTEKKIIPK